MTIPTLQPTEVIERLGALAIMLGQTVPPERLAGYAAHLAPLPAPIVTEALNRAELELTFFPKLNEILALMREALIDKGLLETPGKAWLRAKREARRYHPTTNPQPKYSAPVVKRVIEAMGGLQTFLDTIAQTKYEALNYDKFVGHYERECMSAEHLGFCFTFGRPYHYAPIRGIELYPEYKGILPETDGKAGGMFVPEMPAPALGINPPKPRPQLAATPGEAISMLGAGLRENSVTFDIKGRLVAYSRPLYPNEAPEAAYALIDSAVDRADDVREWVGDKLWREMARDRRYGAVITLIERGVGWKPADDDKSYAANVARRSNISVDERCPLCHGWAMYSVSGREGSYMPCSRCKRTGRLHPTAGDGAKA